MASQGLTGGDEVNKEETLSDGKNETEVLSTAIGELKFFNCKHVQQGILPILISSCLNN